jgi:hypothetical protein
MLEKKVHVRLAYLKKTRPKRQVPGKEQEDYQKYVGNRRRKITLQLSLAYRPETTHQKDSYH